MMMKNLFLMLALVSSPLALGANVQWYDLELYNRYTLTQDIAFENGATFKAGEKFDMQDFVAGGVPVAYFEMHQVDCQDPAQTAEMILVDIGPTIAGAELYEGCNLGLFIEPKDFFNDSAFSE